MLKPLVAALLMGLASAASAGVTLTVSSWLPAAHLLSRAQASWCAEVAKATDNRVACSISPKPVAGAAQTLDAVRDGRIDVSFGVPGFDPKHHVLTRIAELPLLGSSALVNSIAYQRIHARHLARLDEFHGLRVITVFTHGPGAVFNNKRAIRSLVDMDGLRFRVGGGVVNDIGKALGIDMVLEPASQSAKLIGTGAIDGVWLPNDAIVSFKLVDDLKYRTSVPGGIFNTSFVFVMNPAAWAKIPAADQAVIEAYSGEWAARHFGSYWDAADTLSKALQQVAGIEAIAADDAFVADLKAKVDPLEAEWVRDAQGKGLKNAAAVLRELRAEIAKLR